MAHEARCRQEARIQYTYTVAQSSSNDKCLPSSCQEGLTHSKSIEPCYSTITPGFLLHYDEKKVTGTRRIINTHRRWILLCNKFLTRPIFPAFTSHCRDISYKLMRGNWSGKKKIVVEKCTWLTATWPAKKIKNISNNCTVEFTTGPMW